MKANYQSINSYGELCTVGGQSIVECRLPSAEIGAVLLCEPRATLDQATCDNGEVRYGGKLVVSILYENVNGEFCRAERGAEFFHKAEDSTIAPAHSAIGGLSVQSHKLRREGGQLIVSCVVEAKFSIHGQRRYTCLVGGDGLEIRKTPATIYGAYTATAVLEEEDEFECDFAQDILMHGEKVSVTQVRSAFGEVDVRGELCLHFCLLRSDGSLCSYERLTPIKAQVLLDSATPDSVAAAELFVISANVSAATDEERGKSKIVVSYRLQARVTVYEKEETEVARDAYATDVETELKYEKAATVYAMNVKTMTERVQGTPIVSGGNQGEKTLLAVVFPKASAALQKTELGYELQGAIEAKALYKTEAGGVEAVDVALPFLFPTEIGEDGEEPICADVECSVYGFSLRVRAGGETEAEGTLKARIQPYGKCEEEYLTEVIEGAKKAKKTCAISVYVPSAGDDLWATAKRLSVSGEELLLANPNLKFPLKGDERIVIYRQKTEISQK